LSVAALAEFLSQGVRRVSDLAPEVSVHLGEAIGLALGKLFSLVPQLSGHLLLLLGVNLRKVGELSDVNPEFVFARFFGKTVHVEVKVVINVASLFSKILSDLVPGLLDISGEKSLENSVSSSGFNPGVWISGPANGSGEPSVGIFAQGLDDEGLSQRSDLVA
jgi:hypothetical protein